MEKSIPLYRNDAQSLFLQQVVNLQSAQWWQSNFGLEYAVPYNEEEANVILKLSDGQWLHLVKSDQPGEDSFRNQAGSPMFRLTFEVRQIEVLRIAAAAESTLCFTTWMAINSMSMNASRCIAHQKKWIE